VRTLTVKETAKVLGVSVRTIQNRLATNELSGKRITNQYGTSEWRVWPNKEITEKLKDFQLDEVSTDGPSEEFQGGDSSAVLEAESVEVDRNYFEETQAPITTIIREMSQQFAEQLSKEKQINLQLQYELKEKDVQLKLLPDFQKQAEDRRLEAETKELEAIALAKQIEAMKTMAAEKAVDLARLNQLETETLPSLERQLEQERLQRERALEEAASKLSALENGKREAEEAKAKLEESLQSEIARLRDEKDDQAKAIESKFDALNQKLEELKKPQASWWKKLLGSSEN
jgi:DNA repair exonuclease SbcCD ATPase subunit